MFHRKQAIRRKLLSLGIPEEVVTVLMDKAGLINTLLTVPIKDIEPKGIPYMCQHFEEGIHRA